MRSTVMRLGAVSCVLLVTLGCGSPADEGGNVGDAARAANAGAGSEPDAEPSEATVEDHDHGAMDGTEDEAGTGASAVLFAEQIFGPNDGDYGVSFAPDGDVVFFTRALPSSAGEAIFFARRSGDGWSVPELAPFSGDYHDKEPFVSPDGGRVYFASKRPVRGFGARDDFDIWYVGRRDIGFGEPVHVGAVASDSNDDYPAVAADGTIAFARDDASGNVDLWVAYAVDGEAGEPRRFGRPINSVYADADPWIAPDGATIVFSSPRIGDDAEGQGDLYAIHRRGEAWTAPVGLGPAVNSIAHEYGPALSPDGATLYFSRGFGGQIWTIPTASLAGLE